MKSKKFTLISREVMCNCVDFIARQEWNGKVEVIIRNAQTGKTLAQLGGIFGSWVKYIADEINQDGNTDYVERMLKAKFLARIYCEEPMTPEQENWVELLAVYQMANEQEKLLKHAKRISLSWATLSQTKRYMNAIEEHYQGSGHPLPVLDMEWKKWRK